MGFLDSLTSYGIGKWEVTDKELLSKFDKEGFKNIQKAEVTEKAQTWGTSVAVCLFMKNGGTKYIPLSTESSLEVGDEVDLKSIEVLTLSKDGEDDIYRADGKAL